MHGLPERQPPDADRACVGQPLLRPEHRGHHPLRALRPGARDQPPGRASTTPTSRARALDVVQRPVGQHAHPRPRSAPRRPPRRDGLHDQRADPEAVLSGRPRVAPPRLYSPPQCPSPFLPRRHARPPRARLRPRQDRASPSSRASSRTPASGSSRPAARRRTCKEAGLPVTLVEETTGFPEILGGRVKTLHPKIFGGVLADDTRDDHARDLARGGDRAVRPRRREPLPLREDRRAPASGRVRGRSR